MSALRIVWQGFRATYEEMLLLAMLSLLTWACCLLIIPGPPAIAGLYLVASRVADDRRATFDHFKEGFRRFFVRSWIVGGASLLLFLLFVGSLLFYWNLPPTFPEWMQALALVMLYLLIGWCAMQIYLFPLLVEHDLRAGLVFRNALALAFGSPIFSAVLLLAFAVIIVFSGLTTILLFLIAPGLLAVISSLALRDRLDAIRAKARPVA